MVTQCLLCDAGARLGGQEDNIVGDNQGPAHSRESVRGARIGNASGDILEVRAPACAASERTVHAYDLQTVARLAFVDEVVLEHNFDAPRQLSRGCALRHLLDRHHLVVDESRQAVLNLERIVVGIGLRVSGRGDGRSGRGGGREAVGVDAGVKVGRRRAVVNRLLHLWPDEVAYEEGQSALCHRPVSGARLTPRDDAFEANELAELFALECSRRRVVVAKGALETDCEGLLLDHLGETVASGVDSHVLQSGIGRRQPRGRLLQQAAGRRVVSVKGRFRCSMTL